jgi:LacI family transcriptional regulator
MVANVSSEPNPPAAPRARRPTIHDVARAAGVSVAAAGRALGGYGYVSDDIRARVSEAAAELGYRPNAVARSMITGRSHTIGFVAGDIENPFFARMLRGIADTARAQNVEVILTNSDEDLQREQVAVQTLVEKRVDGIIVAPADIDAPDHLQRAIGDGTPIVLLDRPVRGLAADLVMTDNQRAARLAVEYLIGLGHKRIAIIASQRSNDPEIEQLLRRAAAGEGPDVARPSVARVLGYHAALTAANLPVLPYLVRTGAIPDRVRSAPYRAEWAAVQTQQVLWGEDRATAIFSADSDMTLGALQTLARSGLRIPEDVSLLAFDDLDWAAIVQPPLTVIAQPVYELATIAAQRLLARIGGDESEPRTVLLNTRLIERASVAAPPKHLRSANGAATRPRIRPPRRTRRERQ